jgi:hypothetical protein
VGQEKDMKSIRDNGWESKHNKRRNGDSSRLGMQPSFEPFALQLYRRFLGGYTIEELSGEFGIPPERIAMRIRAAEAHTARHAGGSSGARSPAAAD